MSRRAAARDDARRGGGAQCAPVGEVARHKRRPYDAVMALAPGDGRVARREGNRLAVIEAVLAFFDEGVMDPSVEQIIERSGVSERSIFRYFEGLDELRSAVVERTFEQVAPLLVTAGASTAPLDERIEVLITNRLAVFQAAAGTARVARVREAEVPAMAAAVHRFREQLAAQIRALLAPELATRARVEGEQLAVLLAVLLSFEGWELQKRLGRSTDEIRRAWDLGVRALLAG